MSLFISILATVALLAATATMFYAHRSIRKLLLRLGPGKYPRPGCAHCGRLYGAVHGFPDLMIESWAWKQISPTGDYGGLLCPSCICELLYEAGISARGAFLSGPIESVRPEDLPQVRV